MSFNKFIPKKRMQKFWSIIIGLAIVLFTVIKFQPYSQPAYGCMHAKNWWRIIPQAFAEYDWAACCYNSPQCPDGGGGAIPPDADEFLSDTPIATTSAKKNANPAPIGGCWKDDPKARIAPVSWYWPGYKNVHLQVYDSTGAWWYNGWVKSNSYTVFSKDNKGQFPGIPTDGRTVYAKVSYGGEFSEVGKISCTRR